MKTLLISLALLALAVPSLLHAQVSITVDRNTGPEATPAFHFARVPPPAAGDIAARAQAELIAGKVDAGSGGLALLTDGELPTSEDEPATNLFFEAGTWGGRVRLDFGRPIDVAAIDSYSWHPGSRAPQLYKVFGAVGDEAGLNPAPDNTLDPGKVGWKLIAFVDTRATKDEGGQYGVRISDSGGSLGRYRYLLFDLFDTEGDDSWGNTFYSEIDVLEAGQTGTGPRAPVGRNGAAF